MSNTDSAQGAPLPDPSSPNGAPIGPGDHLFLVDGSNFIFRAFFQSMNQDRKYNFRSDGLPTGAVRLFANKISEFVHDGVLGVHPTHLGIIFDKSEDSFRKALYPAYKANRTDPPEELVPQFPLMRAVVSAFGMTPVEQVKYEADDLIATYARQASEAGADVLIISADKDLMQLLAHERVAMYDPASGSQSRGKGFRAERQIGRQEVIDYFGVPPERVVDCQALAGDATDNVPGAPGIGIKTAAQLIADYGSLEAIIARAHEIRQPKRRETLTDPTIIEKVLLSRELVKLVDDVPLMVPLEDLRLVDPDPKALIAFLKAMEFTTITRRIGERYDADVSAIEADARYAIGGTALPETSFIASRDADPSPSAKVNSGDEAISLEAEAARALEKARALPFNADAYVSVITIDALAALIEEASLAGRIGLDTETTGLDAQRDTLVGISIAAAPGRAFYIPLGHTGEAADLLSEAATPEQAPLAQALALLKPLLEDPSTLKVLQNAKFDLAILSRYGIDVAPFDDTMLLSYAADAGRGSHGMDELSARHLGHQPIAFKDVVGSGKNAITFARVPLDQATRYAAEDADVTLRLHDVLKPRMRMERTSSVYERLERPLVSVLQRMEARGIMVDRALLSRLSGEFAQKMGALEAEIESLAGEPFNVGSPKQLGDILFDKMGLEGGKKTKTGAWATPADVLETLAAEGHDLPRKVLDWRQLQKLRSTYTEALVAAINPQSGRVHTSYSLAATTTGRLSSSDPNLQNIPVRTEEGRKIRRAFIAPKGHKIVSADYSQIELRVLADIADIGPLKDAFARGLDIHAMTASEMFGVPVEGMDPMVRRRAKAINFGIIYGISAFGLANQLSIARDEASTYIKTYFERFPGIKAYMDATKQTARDKGYVETLFGRRIHYPEIASTNAAVRAFNERAAINAPIQGTAADIIRRAMIAMEPALDKAGLGARMLLQVHDELIFEVPDEEVEATLPLIRAVMRDAPMPARALSVPLEVEARAADNWDDAH